HYCGERLAETETETETETEAAEFELSLPDEPAGAADDIETQDIAAVADDIQVEIPEVVEEILPEVPVSTADEPATDNVDAGFPTRDEYAETDGEADFDPEIVEI